MTDLIFVEQKPMEGRESTLEPGATIGREGCDINLMDPEVSRRHAAIRDQDGSLAIEDLGSTNGTYVNDRRIAAVTTLKDGDVVRLGNTVWAMRTTAPASPPAAAPSAGQAQAGAPQVTAARAVPTDIQTPAPAAAQATTAQAVPPAAPPAPQQPAQPAAPSAAPVGRRGDVEAPPEVAPSAIRRVLPPPPAGQAPAFQAPASRPGGSAATRLDATIVCMLIVAAAAVALVIYFVTY